MVEDALEDDAWLDKRPLVGLVEVTKLEESLAAQGRVKERLRVCDILITQVLI